MMYKLAPQMAIPTTTPVNTASAAGMAAVTVAGTPWYGWYAHLDHSR